MSKKKELIIEDKFPKQDLDLAMRLFKIAALSSGETDEILRLYRTYINKNQPTPTSGCGGCSNSFFRIYNELREWMVSNSNKFE